MDDGEFDFSEEIREVWIVKEVIKLFTCDPQENKPPNSYVFFLIYKECGNDWLARKRICRMLPRHFYSLSFRLDKAAVIDKLKSAIKLLDWKYGNERT